MTSYSQQSLAVSGRIRIRRERLLPVNGEVLVEKGQKVSAQDPVARAMLPGELQMVKASAALGILASELESAMLVAVGDQVKKGEVLARSRTFFGISTKEATSPVDGILVSVSKFTGQMMLRSTPRPLELIAYLPGEVVEVVPEKGVAIESESALVQGVFGFGQEAVGTLRKVCASPGEPLGDIGNGLEGAVVFCGGKVGLGALEKASQGRAKGVIAASVDGADLVKALGREINPAATGGDGFGFTLVITEGFGDLPMSPRTFEILSRLDGEEVSMNGTTQVRAGAIRPEIVARPCEEPQPVDAADDRVEMVGGRVRVVRGRAFGAIGFIKAAPVEPRRIGTGSLAHIYEVVLDRGGIVEVPRQNVERIDSSLTRK